MTGPRRTALATLLLGGLLLVGATAAAAKGSDCTLSVSPAQGPAGSQFVLHGSGYTPDRLILRRASGEPASFDLDLGPADPFEIPIASKPGDEGRWRASVLDEDTGCRASTYFRVTLQPTDMLQDLLTAPGGGVPPAVYLVIVAAAFCAGTLVARFARVRA
jgi:hypothetical protein